MKKLLLFIWNITLVTIISLFIYSQCVKEEEAVELENPYADMILPNSTMSSSSLDSLLLDYPYVFALIGIDSCDMCKIVYKQMEMDFPQMGKAYFNIRHHENNLLVSQSLLQSGFPMLVVIDQNREIVALCNSYIKNNTKIDSVLHVDESERKLFVDVLSYLNTDKLEYMNALASSFQAALHFIDEDYESMKDYASQSLEYNSFFFNNYLMYCYHENMANADSANVYRRRALEFNRHGNIQSVVYKDKIELLEGSDK